MRRRVWGALCGMSFGALTACGDSGGPGQSVHPMDFYVAFPMNIDATQDATLSLRIAGAAGIGGTVTAPGLAFTTTFTTDGTGLATVSIPATAMIDDVDTVQARGVIIHANDSVAVIAVNDKPGSMHAAALLPARAGDTAFAVMAWGGGPQPGSYLAIAARQATTSVTITPTATSGSRSANAPFAIVLNAGDVYQLVADDSTGDLSGSIIHADKPVSVYGGHRVGTVPIDNCCAGLLWTSIPSFASASGLDFITMPLSGRTGYWLRAVGLRAGTTIVTSGVTGFGTTLNPGQVVTARTTTAARITSNQPILLAQLAEGWGIDGSGTDPCLALVPPVSRYTSGTVFARPATQASDPYVNVVVSSGNAASIRVNGTAPAVTFTAIGSTGYSGAAIPLTALVT
ncbi:MAG TPA: IgGFc-binding protein, partial [Mycobacterium sp.]|nr:IgGFc-binding protein [Mycobacterium sp.]